MATKYRAKQRRRVYIEEWLEALDVSQSELARRMDTSKENVSRWIREQWRITLDVLSGFADALGITDASLLLRDPRASPEDLVRSVVEVIAANQRAPSTPIAKPSRRQTRT